MEITTGMGDGFLRFFSIFSKSSSKCDFLIKIRLQIETFNTNGYLYIKRIYILDLKNFYKDHIELYINEIFRK